VRDIVSDLKDFARDNPSDIKDSVDLNDVIGKAVGLTTNLINKSTRQFKLKCQPGLPMVHGNAQRIEQVVINLVVNACQALPDPDRSVTVATRFEASANRIVLEVTDQGEGIPEEHVKRITDPFFTTKREHGGTGLGLAITERIVRDHGGSLVFESTPGEGTTVCVTLPVKRHSSQTKRRTA
jgi:signal transduction histidine kinase